MKNAKNTQYLLKVLNYLEKNIHEETTSTKIFTSNNLIKNRKSFKLD
jgi:hypothetical protein